MDADAVIADLLKGPGNRHWELVRVSTAIGLLTMCGALIYAIYQGQNPSLLEFGTGFAAIIAAGGFGAKMKDASATPLTE